MGWRGRILLSSYIQPGRSRDSCYFWFDGEEASFSVSSASLLSGPLLLLARRGRNFFLCKFDQGASGVTLAVGSTRKLAFNFCGCDVTLRQVTPPLTAPAGNAVRAAPTAKDSGTKALWVRRRLRHCSVACLALSRAGRELRSRWL